MASSCFEFDRIVNRMRITTVSGLAKLRCWRRRHMRRQRWRTPPCRPARRPSCGGRLHHAAGAFMPAFTPGAPSCHIPAAAYRLTNPCCCAAKCRPGCDCCLLGPAPALVYPICFPSPRPGAAAEARRPLTGLPRRHGAAARRTRPSAVAPLTAAVASLAARAASRTCLEFSAQF